MKKLHSDGLLTSFDFQFILVRLARTRSRAGMFSGESPSQLRSPHPRTTVSASLELVSGKKDKIWGNTHSKSTGGQPHSMHIHIPLRLRVYRDNKTAIMSKIHQLWLHVRPLYMYAVCKLPMGRVIRQGHRPNLGRKLCLARSRNRP
jgi:hypothetical protein